MPFCNDLPQEACVQEQEVNAVKFSLDLFGGTWIWSSSSKSSFLCLGRLLSTKLAATQAQAQDKRTVLVHFVSRTTWIASGVGFAKPIAMHISDKAALWFLGEIRRVSRTFLCTSETFGVRFVKPSVINSGRRIVICFLLLDDFLLWCTG